MAQLLLVIMQTEGLNKSSPHGRLLQPDNPLFTMARSGRLRIPQSWLDNHAVLINKFLYPFSVILFASLVPVISAILGLPISSLGLSLTGSRPDLGLALYLIGGFLFVFLLIWLWLKVMEQRPLWTTGMRRPILKPYLQGLAIGALLFVSVVLLLRLCGFLEPENSGQGTIWWTTLAGTLLVLVGWAIQGAAEEILFRGFLMPILSIHWRPAIGVIFSALLFCAIHLLNPNITLISVLNLFLFGLFTALYALWEGGLWGVFAVHTIWNWAQGNIFGLSVSGLDLHSSILFNLMETGPDWVTGGYFGPEGGVVVTLILICAISILIALSSRDAQTMPGNAG
ncbi:MAG: lysostaphin resistance A-like protein [Candidatus Promineifilaceae bacterium]